MPKGKSKTPRLNYDDEMFDNVDEENGYIMRQIHFLAEMRHPRTDNAGWIAFKMAITRKQAERKVQRARAAEEELVRSIRPQGDIDA